MLYACHAAADARRHRDRAGPGPDHRRRRGEMVTALRDAGFSDVTTLPMNFGSVLVYRGVA